MTRYKGALSSAAAVDLGVTQGSMLGPLLFVLYINYLKDTLTKAQLNLFTDDTVIYVICDCFYDYYDVVNGELKVFADWL